ncbi:hypothetical protein HB364_28455 [Pseudoflavitalea sp. X16]|uniref:hypothetical protein n=1 Tax=Paraflavitalea devenefica TaxID=2716334 RepID=UPI001423E8B3|nr:hypothetical protein [Paraflavitalea devenefica]NII29044.1 hypothetical protein [Paraflavitalea devenefica]
MFEIEYNFSNTNSENIVDADETTLRYSLFLGNLTLKNAGKSIKIDWDWVPLLDFALSMVMICDNLHENKNGEELFEFTESDEKIIFEKNGNKIKITTSFTDDALEMDFVIFKTITDKFYKKLISDIFIKNQELKDNTAFIKYLDKAKDIN